MVLVTRSEAATVGALRKKGFLKNFAEFKGKHLYQSLFCKKVAGLRPIFIKKETLAQVFSCESCEISKNISFEERLLLPISSNWSLSSGLLIFSWDIDRD